MNTDINHTLNISPDRQIHVSFCGIGYSILKVKLIGYLPILIGYW